MTACFGRCWQTGSPGKVGGDLRRTRITDDHRYQDMSRNYQPRLNHLKHVTGCSDYGHGIHIQVRGGLRPGGNTKLIMPRAHS